MIKSIWHIADEPTAEFVRDLVATPRIAQLVLWRHQLASPEAIRDFLEPEYSHLADPFLFKQMHVATDRIIKAITEHEPITVYGDYDADGVTSTAVVVEALRALGANVSWYLPERLSEGYGLNVQAMKSFAEQGTKVLVTVDCGTSNVEEINTAKSLGLDVIVLDHHHQPAELPPADAIINPVFPKETYPFRGLSSAGVAFALVRALVIATNNGEKIGKPQTPGWEKWLLDLVAISTVADMMPLHGENRILVRFGLMVLRKTKRPGIRALFAVMGSQLDRADEHTIGYHLAPRINAAGRLHHASLALELLLSTDPAIAQQLAEQLQGINQDRQQLTEMATAEALEQVEVSPHPAAATAFAPHWSPGILGLVAGRLADRLWRPVLVMSENDGEIIGSGRSVPGVNIMSVMDDGREFFLRYGGHPGACGFTLVSPDKREAFEGWFRERMAKEWEPSASTKTLELVGRAALQDFSPDALDFLDQLGPYGMENIRPLFAIEKARVQRVDAVGSDGQHIRLTISDGNESRQCIGFRFGTRRNEFPIGEHIDLAVEATWNIWQGRKQPQLRIIDVRPHV